MSRKNLLVGNQGKVCYQKPITKNLVIPGDWSGRKLVDRGETRQLYQPMNCQFGGTLPTEFFADSRRNLPTKFDNKNFDGRRNLATEKIIDPAKLATKKFTQSHLISPLGSVNKYFFRFPDFVCWHVLPVWLSVRNGIF